MDNSLQHFRQSLNEQCRQTGWRYAVLLNGERQWGLQTASLLLADTTTRTVLISDISESDNDSAQSIANGIPGLQTLALSQVSSLLGNEFDSILYDAFCGMAPDGLGIVGGAIRAGGALIIIAPPRANWAEYSDPLYEGFVSEGFQPPVCSRYVQRFANICQQSAHCLVITQHGELPALPVPGEGNWTRDFSDQKSAVVGIHKVVDGQRRRPVVLLADRGRGKSAALGIAARQLYEKGVTRIVVTGSSQNVTTTVFKHAGTALDDPHSFLSFRPVDQLIADPVEIDLLMVDEAASIPLSQLARLLQIYPRMAFATTVHGYEGTGRGFILRFGEILDRHTRGWHTRELRIPIRWRQDDPLEQFLFDALLLNAEPRSPDSKQQLPDLTISRIHSQCLVDNEPLLRQLFGLLVQAHYRTRPADLRYLLDAPNVRLFAALAGDQVLGCAMVSMEGGLDSASAREIWKNHSRPRGHRLAETLGAHLGLIDAPTLRYGRTVRIVVHPALRRRGVGSRIVETVRQNLEGKVDLLGTVFALGPEALNFWCANQYYPVRLGHRHSHSSGSHSGVFIKSCTRAGDQLLHTARQKFARTLPTQLMLMNPKPDVLVASGLIKMIPDIADCQHLEDAQLMDLIGFAFAQRNLEDVRPILHRFTVSLLANDSLVELEHRETLLLIESILYAKPWESCESLAAHEGKSQGIARLREITARMLNHAMKDKTRRLRESTGV